jgi:hypothetical protein
LGSVTVYGLGSKELDALPGVHAWCARKGPKP